MVITDDGTDWHTGYGRGNRAEPRRRGGSGAAGSSRSARSLALVAAMGLTVLGLGAADHAVASFDASSWLWSNATSEMARVNGVTGRVDTRLRGARGAPGPPRCRSPRPTGS